jgi:phage terminase large subunit-like protein
MAYAIRAYAAAILEREVKHNGDRLLAEHIGNAVRRPLNFADEDGKPLWVIQKERPDSPAKIDAAMAAVLAWEARNDAVAKGISGQSVYESRGLLLV